MNHSSIAGINARREIPIDSRELPRSTHSQLTPSLLEIRSSCFYDVARLEESDRLCDSILIQRGNPVLRPTEREAEGRAGIA